jgi:hypothetical protein
VVEAGTAIVQTHTDIEMTWRTSKHARQERQHWRIVDAALRRAATYAHPAGHVQRIETHISVIYLAGRHAYKVNKPVNLGFADFTNLDMRQRCCADEVRLNRRLAKPCIYKSCRLSGADAPRNSVRAIP